LELIKSSTEEKLPFSEGFFDLITGWWSLEHINNPNETLQQFSTLLKEKGYCIIAVPNFNSFNARFFKDNWFHLDAPRHLWIYTPSTIKKMLEKNGFSVKKIIYGRNPNGLFSSLQYFYHGSFSVSKTVVMPPFLRKMLFVFIALTALLKISDGIIVCAQKKDGSQ